MSQSQHHESGAFVGLCCYVAAQAWTVPVAAVGVSWAVWPLPADIALAVYVALWLRNASSQPSSSRPNRIVEWSLLAILAGTALSWGLFALAWPVLSDQMLDRGRGLVIGGYQVMRLAQFALLFALVSRTRMTSRQRTILGFVALSALVFVCGTIIADYFGVVSTTTYAGHLPHSVWVAGPWAPYAAGIMEKGLGSAGYNHGYIAVHLLLLFCLSAHLLIRSHAALMAFVLLLMCLCQGLTGSRAGFLWGIVFTAVMLIQLRIHNLARVTAGGLCAVFIVASVMGAAGAKLDAALDRQRSSVESYSGDGFSGRTGLWEYRLAFLNDYKPRWIVGTGYGSAMDNGMDNAHMLYLQIVSETGLLGLAAFLAVVGYVLRNLWPREQEPRPVFWTLVILLGTGLSQETLYPVPAFLHALGLALCIVALSFAQRQEGSESVTWRASATCMPVELWVGKYGNPGSVLTGHLSEARSRPSSHS